MSPDDPSRSGGKFAKIGRMLKNQFIALIIPLSFIAVPARAQRLIAPAKIVVRAPRAIMTAPSARLTLDTRLPSALPLPSLLGSLAIPSPAPSLSLSPASVLPTAELSESIAPEIRTIQDASQGLDAADGAGKLLMDKVLRVESFAAPAKIPAVRRAPRGKPAVRSVSFAESITASQQKAFKQSMIRRKAGWLRGLDQVGISLPGSVEPELFVRDAKDRQLDEQGSPRQIDYTVHWRQGETRVGAFHVRIRLEDGVPMISRLPAPPAPVEKQITLRFLKTASEAEIMRHLESRRLRFLGRSWDGIYTAATTGSDAADAMAKELSNDGMILYAAPTQLEVPSAGRLSIVFKSKTRGAADEQESPVSETMIAEFLKANKLRVLSAKDGRWVVSALSGMPAVELRSALTGRNLIHYALPESITVAENRQAVLRLKSGLSEDFIAAFLDSRGLMVLRDYGGGSYKTADFAQTPSAELALRLSREEFAETAVAVGSLTEERVRSAALGSISQKGRPWSSTEYNAASYYNRIALEMAGATEEQLKLYDELCDAAPVRGGGFNPWSGD